MPAGPGVAAGILCVCTVSTAAVHCTHWQRSQYRAGVWLLAQIAVAPALLSWLSWSTAWPDSPLEVLDLLQRVCRAVGLVAYVKYQQRLLGWKPGGSPEYSEELVESVLMKVEFVRHLPPCCCMQPVLLRNQEEFLTFSARTDLGIMQFVGVVPSLMVAGVVLKYAGTEDLLRYGDVGLQGGWLYVAAMSAVSAAVAGYYVLLRGRVAAASLAGRRFQIQSKVVWTVGVLLVTEAQEVVIGALAHAGALGATEEWPSRDIATSFTSALVAGEMMIAAVALLYIFPSTDFQQLQGQGR